MTPETLTIGALLPVSRLVPRVDHDFLAGLRGALAEREVPCEILCEPVGTAADGEALADAIRRLLLRSGPDLVTGITGAGAAPLVHTLFRDARTPFVVNGLGGDPLLLGGADNPWIFWNSFGVWKSTYALGYWAARNLGETAALATGFHEAGYAMVEAFWNGFERAGGGTVLATRVTHRDSRDEDPAEDIRALLEHDPDFVVGLYSGREGISFMEAYRGPAGPGDLPLVVSPFALYEPWLRQMGKDALGVRTVSSWSVGAHPELEEAFSDAYARVSDDEPGAFGMLGYETGRMIGGAVEALGGTVTGRDALRDALAEAVATSPRGRRAVDPASGDVETFEHLLVVEEGPEGPGPVAVEGPLELPERYEEDLAAFRRRPLKNGWLNPYLVT